MWWEEIPGSASRSESSLCPIISAWPSKHLFTKHVLFCRYQWLSSFFLNMFVYLFGCVGSLQHLGSLRSTLFLCTGCPVVAHRLNCPSAWGIFVSQPGIEPESSALGSRFLITGPLNHWTKKVLHSSFLTFQTPTPTSSFIFS